MFEFWGTDAHTIMTGTPVGEGYRVLLDTNKMRGHEVWGGEEVEDGPDYQKLAMMQRI